jgi:hypothetical protein
MPKKPPVKKQPIPPKKKVNVNGRLHSEEKPEKAPRGYEFKTFLVKKEVKRAADQK